jgi:hypothetical protein
MNGKVFVPLTFAIAFTFTIQQNADAASLSSGSYVTLKLSGGYLTATGGGGSTVVMSGSTASTNQVFKITDITNPNSATAADKIYLQAANGKYLARNSAGAIVATGTSGYAFLIYKVTSSSSAGTGILSGDSIYLEDASKHPCGPSSSAAYVCTASYPDSTQFMKLTLQSAPSGTPAPTPTPTPTGNPSPTGGIPSDSSGVAAVQAQKVLGRFGVNTHMDFARYGYENVAQTIADINYTGNGMIKILRDSPGGDEDLTIWPSVAKGTGAKFDAYIGEGAPTIYADNLGRMQKMKASGGNYIFSFEGGNEEDDPYPKSLGNSQQQAAAFQKQVWDAGVKYGVPVFNISFGSGWCGPQDPTCLIGDYATVGNLAAYTNYANAHTYPQYSPNGKGFFANLNHDANLAAAGKPVVISEYGWTTNRPGGWGNVSQSTHAAYVLEGLFDAFKQNVAFYLYYAFYDDSSGSFGLFSTSGKPKLAATALRVLYQLVGDNSSNALSFAPGTLNYSLSGLPANQNGLGGQQLLLQKSDGSFWLALWNEQALNTSTGAAVSVAPVNVTLTLGKKATSIAVYDLLQTTAAVKTAANATSLVISVPAHPVLVKIVRP